MATTRRQFLLDVRTLLAGAAVGGLFPNVTAWGAETPRRERGDHLFVLVRAFGGLDVTLGLDPWVLPPDADANDMFLEYRPDDILTAGKLRFGPSAEALVPWASECLVLNGMMMRRDAGHDAVHQYMITGRGDGKAGALPVELGLARGLLPFGIVANGSVYTAGKAAGMSATADILNEASSASLVEWIEEQLTIAGLAQPTPWEEAAQHLIEGKAAAAAMQELLKKFQQEGGTLADKHAIAAALASGGAEQAQLDLPFVIGGNILDTHANHEGNHARTQALIWKEVTELFALFKRIPYRGGSLFDATTFAVVSEFSRTPYLNGAKGKDHNPMTNSVLLAGKGIRKGTTVGKSRLVSRKQSGKAAEHIAHPFNYTTGTFATGPEGASFFYPENFVRTLGTLFSAGANFTPVATTVPLIPGIIA